MKPITLKLPKVRLQYADYSEGVARLLCSFGLILLLFFAYNGYKYYEIQELFGRIVPLQDEDERTIATVFLSTFLVCITLVFMIHSEKLAVKTFFPKGSNQGDYWYWHWSKVAILFISVVVGYYFWEPWSEKLIIDHETLTDPVKIKRLKWFVISLNVIIDYGFAYLLKYYLDKFDIINRLQRMISDLMQTVSDLEQTISDKEYKISQLESNITQLSAKVKKREAMLLETTCPKCGQEFKSKHAVNAHFHRCKEGSNSN